MTTDASTPANWPEPAKAGARRSVLAADLTIDGDVTSTGPVEVHGKVSGQVTAPEILIATGGIIEGSAIANDLSIQGGILGSVDARNVVLASGAVVRADVIHGRIAVESGAEIEGLLIRRSRSHPMPLRS